MKAFLIRLFAYSLVPLMTVLSGPSYGLDDEQIKRGRLLAGKFISQKKFDRADAVLKKLGQANDPPSLHLRALLILQRKVSGRTSEAVQLLCAASSFGYEKSSLALDKLGRNCSETAVASSRSSVPNVDDTRENERLEAFAETWLGEAPKRGYRVLGNGSGVAISDQGYFLTNHHVISDCPLPVIQYQGLKGSAKVIFANEKLDVAVLKVNALTPHFVQFEPRSYDLGETLYAAGYPLSQRMGDDLKLTRGMLMSARDDERGWIPKGFLLTDIPVGSGNSGGPIFSESGTLRGLVAGIWFWSEDIPEEAGQMSDNPTAAVSGLEIIKYLDSRQSGLYTVRTGQANTLKSTEIARFAEKVTVKVECIEYDKR